VSRTPAPAIAAAAAATPSITLGGMVAAPAPAVATGTPNGIGTASTYTRPLGVTVATAVARDISTGGLGALVTGIVTIAMPSVSVSSAGPTVVAVEMAYQSVLATAAHGGVAVAIRSRKGD
jgi:hypothetical protein